MHFSEFFWKNICYQKICFNFKILKNSFWLFFQLIETYENMRKIGILVRLQLEPSRVKPKTGCKPATALPIHVHVFFFHVFFCVCIYNWTTLNAYISVNSQPIWVKLWILYLMTNPNKVYDTTRNLNKSQQLQMLRSQSILNQFCSNFGI